MAYGQSAKNANKPGKPWHVRGESSDGMKVTLGRYETEQSAEADMSRMAQEGFYRKLKIVFEPPPPDPEESSEG